MADVGPIAALSAAGEAAGSQAQFALLLQLIAKIANSLAAGNISQAWVPVDASGAALALTAVSARTFAFGPITFITGAITYPATADTSHAAFGGLPAPLYNQASAGGDFLITYGTSPALIGRPVLNTDTFSILTQAGAAVTNATLSTLTLRFQFFYPTA